MEYEKIIWRLKEQPTSESLRELVKDKILTNEEARQILFSTQTIGDNDQSGRSIESLETEIKFLRELIEKLSQNKRIIVEIIEKIKEPYYNWQWYQPYYNWNSNTTMCSNDIQGTLVDGTNNIDCSFTAIKTF